MSCIEKFGDNVEESIGSFFHSVGTFVGHRPKQTILLSIVLTIVSGVGYMTWETENRGDKLWVPQDTTAEKETDRYQEYFDDTARFNSMIVQASGSNNVLEKSVLEDAMRMHSVIATRETTYEGRQYALPDLCTQAGGSCASAFEGACACLMTSILKQWNYDLETLQNDTDILGTINAYGSKEDLEAILGNPQFEDGRIVSAEAFTLAYYLERRVEVERGTEVDPENEQWEEEVFLDVAESVPSDYPALTVDYLAGRSFEDEFGAEIEGDLVLVQISYFLAFIFLAANLGKIRCGNGSRWTMALAALFTVGLSTAAGLGLSSLFGLFFGPVHTLLPFILLGIGVDDAFVIVNAFDRERKVPRASESNEDLGKRCARALARAGASITVTSLTDLVAFGISSSSSLPALASFCAYCAISIFYLWFFAATFFTANLVLDERRQRDNRRECAVCLKRKNPVEEEDDQAFDEGHISSYFRKYHAPAILSVPGKIIVLTVFAGLLAVGLWGAQNLSVEDSERAFVPEDSYLNDYLEVADEYFPNTGIDVFFIFEGSTEIFDSRQALADLDDRLTGLSQESPYIAEPVSESAYRNVMQGLRSHLSTYGSDDIGGVVLGEDQWPTSEEDLALTLKNYTSFGSPGSKYAQDVSFSDDDSLVRAISVQSEYVRLTKTNRGEIIDDADRQIEAMDDTRTMVSGWQNEGLPPAFPYSEKFLTIEGFKIIQRELFTNVGLAIAAVGVIVFFTVASPVTAILITVNVAFCIIEILGFMYVFGIVIDSVSVINIVLAVGLSVDYSAHVGHCFMVKGGDKNKRALESLADIGAAVLNGAMSTFLAVVVLFFSTSYVFVTLSRQFALTVVLGLAHGLILLPVLLSMFGPKPFSSASHGEAPVENEKQMAVTTHVQDEQMAGTSHAQDDGSSDDNDKKKGNGGGN